MLWINFLNFSGQILPTSDLTETFELELVHNNVKYSVMVNRNGPINFLVKINDSEVTTEIRDLENGTLLVTSVEGSQVIPFLILNYIILQIYFCSMQLFETLLN